MANPHYPPLKAKVDDITNLLTVQTVVSVAAPFNQELWENPASTSKSLKHEVSYRVLALYAPNPSSPFKQGLWESAAPPKAKAATGEAIGGLSSLFTPNPAAPFGRYNQYEWRSPAPAKAKATGEPVARIAALFTPNPSQPFRQSQWDSPTKILLKAVGEPLGGDNSLLTPNPSRPFRQHLWENSAPQKKSTQVDTVELLLPLYSFRPFVNSTDVRTFARQAVKSDIIVNYLPLRATTAASPFSMLDWPNPRTAKQSSYLRDFSGSPFPSSPTTTGGLPHTIPFIATMGRMTGR